MIFGAIHYLHKGLERGRGWKNLDILTYFGGGGGQTYSYIIFSKSIFYIRNRAVKWIARDHISKGKHVLG